MTVLWGYRRIALSIRLKKDKFSRRRPPQSCNSTLKVSDVNLQLVTVRIEEVERVTLAVIFLPLLRSGIHQARTKSLVVRRQYGKCNVVVCRIQSPFGQVRFECQAYPEIARSEVRTPVPASYRTKPQSFAVEAECAIQIDDRKRYVIQARNHIQKATTASLNARFQVLRLKASLCTANHGHSHR